MTILNIHDCDENYKNTCFQVLESTDYATYSPTINYKSDSLETIHDALSLVLEEIHVNVIVATGLGVFIVKELAVLHSIPIIGINPCINGDLIYFKYNDIYHSNLDYISRISLFNTYANYSKDVFIVSKQFNTALQHYCFDVPSIGVAEEIILDKVYPFIQQDLQDSLLAYIEKLNNLCLTN